METVGNGGKRWETVVRLRGICVRMIHPDKAETDDSRRLGEGYELYANIASSIVIVSIVSSFIHFKICKCRASIPV
jgi:hypothetical protein